MPPVGCDAETVRDALAATMTPFPDALSLSLTWDEASNMSCTTGSE